MTCGSLGRYIYIIIIAKHMVAILMKHDIKELWRLYLEKWIAYVGLLTISDTLLKELQTE